jgi:(2R)-3-sulfolactate dehydrogenase (NADP+)
MTSVNTDNVPSSAVNTLADGLTTRKDADQRLSLKDTTNWISAAFVRHGCTATNAASVARALVAAEADGLTGHGISRLPTYLQMLRAGKIDGHARPSATQPRFGVLTIDAANGFAYPAIDLAVSRLPAIASQQGIATASIRRSNHCGAAGLACEALARAGMIGLLFANTPRAMAPWGGRHAVFGTNPIAFAAPVNGRDPLVIDLALSKVARGPIASAKQLGERIPEGWALDADGNTTTDPAKALQGTMIPLGDAKGAVLALMVEVLAACLTGGNLAFEASSYLDGAGPPPATGQLILAIDATGFGHTTFDRRITTLIAAIEDQPGARLPGTRRFTNRANANRNGLVIPHEIRLACDSG